MNNEEKRPRITIRSVDGDCIVEVHDKENVLLLQQPVLDEDPYLFISRLREAIDGAQIVEEPGLPDEFNVDEVPYVRVINKQINELTRLRESIREYFADLHAPQGEDNERSFTENLS